MRRNIISIDERGCVSVPNGKIMMSDYEIAHLLGIMYPAVKGVIKRLLKSRALVDSHGAVVQGQTMVPEYYGLEVVIAAAFQVDGYRVDIFRKWVMKRLSSPATQPILIQIDNKQIFN